MLTIAKLAKRCGVSRTTILHYEKEGVLLPALRTSNGYRWYGDREVERLQQIKAYRSYGLPLRTISSLLSHSELQAELLKRHFYELEGEITRLRRQQEGIVALLNDPNLIGDKSVTKKRWVEIMTAAGFSEEDMTKWHQTFETLEPEEHQKFLVSLGIGAEEIAKIRAV
ncbi:MerR family transcriptional regulator [Neptunomonas sp. XY-337]|uniref:MerR family transcriptional regulator n=1 Tax=Neptunomonas sp. XY-337 TaxID=2561897 RepID=UPI0010A9A258|nr:MerR family transcriptional regulator [Neptunomonas sp. XY-337]